MKFVVLIPLKIRTQDGIRSLRPGDTFLPKRIAAVTKLIESEKIRPRETCYVCHRYEWWFSIYGALVCGVCHPPADNGLIKTCFAEPQSEELSKQLLKISKEAKHG